MAKDLYIFKRVEKKYRINTAQMQTLLARVGQYLIPDEHGKSTICSLYLDTPTYLLIRNSIEARTYKEKLRLRSYGVPTGDSRVFLEIKKKYKGVVYKRRVSMTLDQAKTYMASGVSPIQSQIMSEIDYAMQFYGNPQPSILVAYEREAFYVKDLPNVRLTFDGNIRYRNTDLFLENGNHGTAILPQGELVLEIKTDGAMPLWLSAALNECNILPSSFSKCGNAYRMIHTQQTTQQNKGELNYASNF